MYKHGYSTRLFYQIVPPSPLTSSMAAVTISKLPSADPHRGSPRYLLSETLPRIYDAMLWDTHRYLLSTRVCVTRKCKGVNTPAQQPLTSERQEPINQMLSPFFALKALLNFISCNFSNGCRTSKQTFAGVAPSITQPCATPPSRLWFPPPIFIASWNHISK